ncbi:hypothetical protein H6G54_11140 [Anabaena cylindrica FACHB-243]|uniref:Cas10/Cmr2 second palm domain-containing protein n=1 Tax=Anabaena cylindrica (strain ATCC 27899 / PCC 7122) TaxID=272123 RepID=K9ZQ84_ANACC|nr:MULTISPECIES: hypothetical protein [Anabaena]AFZ60964.1 hypothetical protein Anacy_5657 [Anabaena cylindrica PCC 7122]MBD2418247.1 hypothetical protein [Anabaena cylindrica FACHB-243]MBY5284534.1 hypothetical protein [Anabaena sp. CCAP 1446/1C]MBY5311693.1 hypothetical protein [Anabaena sp. CCAP 1446/1C]MCM2409362.1 hypothetical protein [Anabaena sp. CCAP 1446/1C]
MSKYIATVIDTTGIQPYIFGSNRLRENIGASYLVEQATNGWVKCALRQIFGENVYIPEPEQEEKCIEHDNLDAELVYTGGGNAVILFKGREDKKSAIRFTKRLSKRVLQEAPGLKIVVAHSEPFEWGNKLSGIVDSLMKKLERKKREYNPSVPLLGLGVTANCLSTGLSAVDTSDRYSVPTSYPVSREIVEKLRAVDPKNKAPANQELNDTIFKNLPLGNYIVPYDIDDLGRTEGKISYMAIVHADGNGMGDRFKEHGRKCKTDREYITAMRELSKTVNQAGVNALKKVAQRVIHLADGKLQEQFAITERNGEKYLPFRPIVYGGDDVTFVCDGRLGLSLAALYLKEFEAQKVADGKDLTACVGIAIVKTHYPFARAYQLSESLCKKAKNFVRSEKEELKILDFSALDWHIAPSGLLGSISDIRQREYQVAEGNLTMRPLYLHSDSDWRNWDDFSEVVNKFNTDSDWSRNKVIALREQLRQGSEKTKQFLQVYGLNENYLPQFGKAKSDDLYQSGWIDHRTNTKVCGYFDAIEAMEFHIPLKEKSDGDLLSENATFE